MSAKRINRKEFAKALAEARAEEERKIVEWCKKHEAEDEAADALRRKESEAGR